MKSHDEIMQLLAAGFTREEILAMPETETTEQEPAAQPDPQPVTQDLNAFIEKMNKTLEDLNNRIIDIQAANIVNNTMTANETKQPMTPEEALSELISPGSLNRKG